MNPLRERIRAAMTIDFPVVDTDRFEAIVDRVVKAVEPKPRPVMHGPTCICEPCAFARLEDQHG